MSTLVAPTPLASASASIHHHACPTSSRLAALAYREGQIQRTPPPLRRPAGHRGQREAAPPPKMRHRTSAEWPLQDRAGHDQLESSQAFDAHSVRL